jgi:flagellar FliL protein
MAATATATPTKGTAAAETPARPKGKKRKLLVIALVLILAVGGAAGFFLLGGSSDAAPKEPPKPEPGVAIVLDPITVNLAGGRYLRIGLTIQMAKTKNAAPEPPDGSRALDQAILLLTNASADSLQKPEQLESLKAELTKRISAVYDGDVMEVLLTQFVIQ